MAYLMPDYTKQLFVAHNIHQRGEHTHTAVGTCKGIHINNIINLEIQRYPLNTCQPLRELVQTDCVRIVSRGYRIMLIHPVDIFLHIFGHLFISKGHGLYRICGSPYRLFQIELRHGRHGNAHHCNGRNGLDKNLFHFEY